MHGVLGEGEEGGEAGDKAGSAYDEVPPTPSPKELAPARSGYSAATEVPDRSMSCNSSCRSEVWNKVDDRS